MTRRLRRLFRSTAPIQPAKANLADHIRIARSNMEMLERRTMLCLVHTGDIIELRPDLVGEELPTEGGPAADVVWINRGQTSDGFASTFGANAETARRVIDAVIVAFERMIGSFNYSDGSANFNLTVRMSGNHNGASASLGSTLGGKPKSGTITMGKGSNGFGAGWFIDPTPDEHSEFRGSIVNAFSGNAQGGSPAVGLGDFYTVASAEITHVLGLYGSALPLWSSKTTNTGVPDTAEGGGVGTFYVFQGPSIKHLLTSNNGGAGGQNFGSAVHGAGPNVPVNFGGETYMGAQDIGNAVYEFSRRYVPGLSFSLMFKDAFGYSTVDPSQFGTFYSILNSSTGQVLVRGGASASADNITITTSGSILTVSVDIGNDVPGTGSLPGNGNLPAFVTQYDISQVNSILIQSGDGNDTITINGLPNGISLEVQAANDNDVITINGTGTNNTITLLGGFGLDTYNINETDPSSPAIIVGGLQDDVLAVNADGVGSAEARFTFTQRFGAVNIGDGGLVTVPSGANVALTLTSLSINSNGRFDLGDNDAIIDYTGDSPLASIQAMLVSGYNNGAWNGNGISSSAAAANSDTALGYAEASDLFTSFPATFSGQSVDDSSILIAHTLYGDLDLDGSVGLTDFNRLAANFGASPAGWAQGNLDFDNDVDLNDFNRLAAHFGQSQMAPSSGGESLFSSGQRRNSLATDLEI